MQGEQLGLVVVAPRREPPCTMQGQAVQEILKEARSLAPPPGRGISGMGPSMCSRAKPRGCRSQVSHVAFTFLGFYSM